MRTNLHLDENLFANKALNQAARTAAGTEQRLGIYYSVGTMVEYAVKRTKEHLSRFNKLYDDIRSNNIDVAWLADIEGKIPYFRY